jgi:L-glutaminase (EC 3.5.1.2)
MSCSELASAFQYLATGGLAADGEEVATARQVKRVNAVMLTCGVYDEAGDYAYRSASRPRAASAAASSP